MPFCSSCGSEVGESKFCPKCGAAVAAAEAGTASSQAAYGGTDPSGAAAQGQYATGAAVSNDNVMGALAYVTFIPAIIFLIIEPYKNIKFIRFHSFQCLFFCAAAFAISIAMTILSIVLAFVGIGALVGLLGMVVNLAFLVVWVLLVVKAYQGQMFKLPVIGDLAEKQA